MSARVAVSQRNKEIEAANLKIGEIVKSLNKEWDIGLELLKVNDSPSKRPRTLERECVFKISALCFKKREAAPLQEFEFLAKEKYNGWINKRRADPDLIPKVSRHLFRPLSPNERAELLEDLLVIVSKAYGAMPQTPSKRGSEAMVIDDNPLPINLSTTTPGAESKRPRDGFDDIETRFKKPKCPSLPASKWSPSMSNRERGRLTIQDGHCTIRSADASISSRVSSVFDMTASRDASMLGTQGTDLDDDLGVSCQPDQNATSLEGIHSSKPNNRNKVDEFVTSFFPLMNLDSRGELGASTNAGIHHGSSDSPLHATTPATRRLRESLAGIFPVLPDCLLKFPLHVRYEVVRVFLHTRTPLEEFRPPLKRQKWTDYKILWRFLTNDCEALQGKTFPERTPKEIWLAAEQQFQNGSCGVTMGGSLRYHNASSAGPLFRFHLHPLKLERTHRLGRRFGNDRFLEIDIPRLTGKFIPKVLRDAGPVGVIQWLRKEQQLFGRTWSSFSTKPKDGRELKAVPVPEGDVDTGTSHRIYFFATGDDFDEIETLTEDERAERRSSMSIHALLEWIRPTLENQKQSYLKLYSRTPLALSRNTATVILSHSQIIEERDIKNGRFTMTDGAGRVSLSLALKIRENMGLSYLPTGFQARLGPCKGFWVIDLRNNTTEDWIAVYDSQRKWERTGDLGDMDFNDPAHRTFEVNKCSAKLKSADLNPRLLPILMDRAKNKSRMRRALTQILNDGLTEYIKSQREAMEKPELFRKWVRDMKPSSTEKLKHGLVLCKGAMPVSLEERINMFLDAGFNPLKLHFLRDLAEKIYAQECECIREKLKIAVPRSTYAFMVPDWTGTLEADEVYIHPSECFVEQDKFSPMAGLPIHGIDVLVARSPAHFVSDIQKVRAVLRSELAGLKDVILFSIKGTPSLAEKLSGGDYDGDLAWVTWESTIVDNFVNAEYQEPRDLVKEGYIVHDATTYEELVTGLASTGATDLFLQKSFEFNLSQNMLGICTRFKERLCYTQETIDSREARILSSLLSCLVDQAKQGYIFTETQWDDFKSTVIVKKPGPDPLYFGKEVDSTRKHIIDHLKYTAYESIERLKTDFYNKMPKHTPYTDDDLLAPFHWAKKQAVVDKDWVRILEQLTKDVEAVKAIWVRAFGQKDVKEDLKPSFGPILAECHYRFCSIEPAIDTELTKALLEGWHSNTDLSQWALLRASLAFATYPKRYVSSFVWWVAGAQLCHIKAKRCHPGMVVMAHNMYAMMKPDATFVRLKISEQKTYEWQKDLTDGVDDGVDDMEC